MAIASRVVSGKGAFGFAPGWSSLRLSRGLMGTTVDGMGIGL